MVDACINSMGEFRDSNKNHRNNLTIKRDHQIFLVCFTVNKDKIYRDICHQGEDPVIITNILYLIVPSEISKLPAPIQNYIESDFSVFLW